MSDGEFDLIVIGAGPGGYVAAIRASQLGMRTACIDKREAWGGTCLNVGCIPSKALLNSSEKFAEAGERLASHGVKFNNLKLDLKAMMARKDKVVNDLTKGIDFLFKKNKITGIRGTAKIVKAGIVEVESAGRKEVYTTKAILIATGSEVSSIPGLEIDEKHIVSSTGVLSLKKVPKHLVVVGGGYIGLEMGSVWRRLGAEVTIIEFLDTIVPTMDVETAAALQKALEKQGMKFQFKTKVVGAEISKSDISLCIESNKNETLGKIKCDVVLVSIGRKPCTNNLGLETTGVEIDAKGFIKVDLDFKTNVPGIYAIGDVIPGPMLAHKAEEEGVVCVERIAGQAASLNYGAIPAVVYTSPEVASVGRSEKELDDAGIKYSIGKFPFTANSRARANGELEGFVKILADSKSDEILGVHIIGSDAGTMIAEMVVALEFGASAEDIARICHAHPTLNEAVKEAALGVEGASIHI